MAKNQKGKETAGRPRGAQAASGDEMGLERGAPSLVAMDSPDDSQLGAPEPPRRAEGKTPD